MLAVRSLARQPDPGNLRATTFRRPIGRDAFAASSGYESRRTPHGLVRTDFLVLGSGIAGLSFALRAAAHGQVVVAHQARLRSTRRPAGLRAAWLPCFSPEDSFDKHAEDTARGGRGPLPRRGGRSVRARGARSDPVG